MHFKPINSKRREREMALYPKWLEELRKILKRKNDS